MRLTATLLSCLLCAMGSAQAETVVLASGDDYAPYADRKLPEGGLTTEIVNKAFAEVKVDVKTDWLPWKRGFEETKEGKYPATHPYLKTAEREKDFYYSSVLVELKDYAFVKAANKNKFDFANPASLAGTRYCLPLGWAATPKLADMLKSGAIKQESPKDISTCVKMVANDRADYIVSDEYQGQAALKTGGIKDGDMVKAEAPALADNSLYLIVSKAHPNGKDLLTRFDKGLESLRKSGAYAKIIKSHLK